MAQNSDSQSLRSDDILKLAAEIVAAYVSNNPVPASELPASYSAVRFSPMRAALPLRSRK